MTAQAWSEPLAVGVDSKVAWPAMALPELLSLVALVLAVVLALVLALVLGVVLGLVFGLLVGML